MDVRQTVQTANNGFTCAFTQTSVDRCGPLARVGHVQTLNSEAVIDRLTTY